MDKTTIVFKSGGQLGGSRAVGWRVSKHPKLKNDYAFAPGVPTEVDADDALVLLDPANVGGRVFERHEPKTTRPVDKTKKADPPPTTQAPSTVPASQPPTSTTTTPPASTATTPPSTIG